MRYFKEGDMQRKFFLALLTLILLGILAGSGAPAGKVVAQPGSVVNWWVLAGGGGKSAGGDVQLNATLGQGMIGSAQGGITTLAVGYWHPEMGPTAVTIATFEVFWQAEQVLVAWETTDEIDLIGFNLYRAESEGGLWLQVNPELIPSQYLGQPEGGSYTWLDGYVTPGETYYYTLDTLDTQQRSAFTGPVRVNYRMHLPLICR
jgi:hypothetical protein